MMIMIRLSSIAMTKHSECNGIYSDVMTEGWHCPNEFMVIMVEGWHVPKKGNPQNKFAPTVIVLTF